jgi:hypothetical protein
MHSQIGRRGVDDELGVGVDRLPDLVQVGE